MSPASGACVAERYLYRVALGRADWSELQLVESHTADCWSCRRRLRELRDHVEAARFAVNLISPAVSFCQLHETADGLVRLWAEAVEPRAWQAGCHGPGVNFAGKFPSASEAVRRTAETFAALFPNHACSRICCNGLSDNDTPC